MFTPGGIANLACAFPLSLDLTWAEIGGTTSWGESRAVMPRSAIFQREPVS
jgi:hypothetical protein